MAYLLSAANVDAANIEFGEAVLMSLIGFAIVMAVLCVLMGIIYLMAFLFKKAQGKDLSFKTLWAKITKKPAVREEVPAPVEEAVAEGTAGEFKLNGVPPEIAAMAMAIVADELKTPLNELRFLSIKEIGEASEQTA